MRVVRKATLHGYIGHIYYYQSTFLCMDSAQTKWTIDDSWLRKATIGKKVDHKTGSHSFRVQDTRFRALDHCREWAEKNNGKQHTKLTKLLFEEYLLHVRGCWALLLYWCLLATSLQVEFTLRVWATMRKSLVSRMKIRFHVSFLLVVLVLPEFFLIMVSFLPLPTHPSRYS